DSEPLDIQDYLNRFPRHETLIHQAWEKIFGPHELAADPGQDAQPAQAIHARYAKQSLHRQGGIGRIWIAHDNNLNRKVALKDLQPEYTEDPAIRDRFIREAQITGKLDHPNIVPVYQLRQGSDVTDPFYTMRLVEGKTLREIIGQHPAVKGRREQVKLLNVLTTVCQTIAYAHSRGVIHRDLKPDNIVVGDYGEIFVLDWGLARSTDEPDMTTDQEVIPHVMATDETNPMGQTRAGTRIGTPAYMAPEQAAGKTDQIGIRTDIYGLGTILFEILTGQAPHQARDADRLLQQIQNEPTPKARSLNVMTPPALDAICGKAMSKDSSQRYASALELNDAIQSWIADEPVDCYLEPWWERCSRWTRHHRRLMNSVALLMLLATVGLGVGNRLLNSARQRTEKQKESAETDFQQARSVIEEISLGIHSPEARQLVGFKPLQHQLTQQLLDFYLYFLEKHRDETTFRAEIADVHYQLGVLASALETLDSARLHYENSLKLLRQLSKDEPGNQTHPRKLSECYNSLGTLLQRTGDLPAAESYYLKASGLLAVLATDPSATDADRQRQMTVLNNLATLYMIRGKAADAIASFQEILTSKQPVTSAAPRTTLAAYLNLSVLYRNRGKLAQAGSSLEKANMIIEQLRKDEFNLEFLHDQQLTWYINQANLEISLGNWETARQTSTAGIEAAKTLIKKHPGELKYEISLAQLHLNTTAIWTNLQNIPEASRSAQAALLILQRLHDQDPGNIQYQSDLARGFHNLAESERRLQHRETALQTIKRAIQEKELILEKSPTDRHRHLLLSSRLVHADLMRDAKDYQPALEQYQEIYAQARELVKNNGTYLPYQFTLATVAHSLGQMEKENKQWDLAREHYREALGLRQQRSARNPGQSRLLLDTSMTQYNLGNLHQVQSQLKPALVLYREAYNTLLKIPASQAQQANIQKHLMNCHWAIAETTHALKQYQTALKHWNAAIQLTNDNKFMTFLKAQREKTARQLPDKG
ncbi:MAG: protein kinase, partial [Planctomycetota bacterium]|nr:protein kinase [Planctomycetota bacterium]